MTTHTSQPGLHVLPGGCLTEPTLLDLLPLLPVETWLATSDWTERLPDARLAELVSAHVVRPIRTWPGTELGRPAWRKLAEVLLTEMIRRSEGAAPC